MISKILVSHEIPEAYLELSRQFNDYDYALVHLFDENPKYREFFKESIKMGRRVLLDNSAYEINTNPELKEKYPQGFYPMDKYAEWIKWLKPTEYVLPDVKESSMGTINVVKEWCEKYGGLPGKKIGVAHGVDQEEFQRCYDAIEPLCDKMAFSFENWWFDYQKRVHIKLEHLRPSIIMSMNVNPEKPHHILGCILPQEFRLWRSIEWVETIDTSAPITNALEGKLLEDRMMDKPKTTIHGSFNIEYNEEAAQLMIENAKRFKQLYLNVE